MKVPFQSLPSQLRPQRQEIEAAFASVLERAELLGGQETRRFEVAFAKYCGAPLATAMGSGFDALGLALRVSGVGEGTEVILPANAPTWMVLAARFSGAKVVLCGIDPDTFMLEPGLAEAAITSKTRAIVAVHLYGRFLELEALLALSEKHELKIIEEATHAPGVRPGPSSKKRAGAFGHLGCIGFDPESNLTCLGELGMVLASDAGLREKLENLREQASRPGAFEALSLSARLGRLDSANAARFAIARKYEQGLRGTGDLELQHIPAEGTHVYSRYVIRTKRRDTLREWLARNEVQTVAPPGPPSYLSGLVPQLEYRAGDFPVAEQHFKEGLCLPIFAGMGQAQVAHVIEQVRKFYF